MKVIKIGTDYSGIGSPEEALKELQYEGFLKFESEFACDIDKFARASHDAIHKTKKMYLDITERNHSEVPQLGLYIAGFPCQSFSIAGKGKGFEDVRGTLFFNTAEFIRINQPDTFILENVKGLLSHDKGKTFQTIIDLLSNCGGTVNGQMALDFFDDGLGYHIHYKVLNTKEHGIPQNRERIFIVGFKESRDYGFPIKEPLELRLKDLLEDEVDEKYFLSEKLISGFINHKNKSKEKGHGFGWRPTEGDGVANCLQTNATTRPDANFIIKEGFINQDTQASQVVGVEGISPTLSAGTHGYAQGYIEIKSNTKKGFEEAKEGDSVNYAVPTSKTRRGRVGKQVAQTLDTGCNQGVVEDMRIRRLTPLECWRLQGFSDESFYKAQKVNSDTQLYKQAGNSITKHVIKKIIKNIYK